MDEKQRNRLWKWSYKIVLALLALAVTFLGGAAVINQTTVISFWQTGDINTSSGQGTERSISDNAVDQSGVSPAPGMRRLTAEASGSADAGKDSPAARERSAVLEAEMHAKSDLARQLGGELIESMTTIELGVVKQDTINSTITAILKGATTVEKTYDDATGEAFVRVEVLIAEAIE